MTFPVDAVPDGNVLLAHHFVYPLVAAVISTMKVWPRDKFRNPWLVLTAILAGLWGFTSGWTQDPTLGAAVTGAALVVGLSSLLARPLWRHEWPQGERWALVLLFAAATDDWISHALGLPTPLDWAFHQLPLWPVGAVAVAMGTLVYVGLRVRFPRVTSA